MKTVEIGQTGKLGSEILTIVSFNEKIFKCDNGKMYMIESAKWMTEGLETAATKMKKASKIKSCPEDMYTDEACKHIDFDALQQKSRMNQRGSSLR